MQKTVIAPFKPYIYNTDKVKFDEVTAPPYDVINEELQDKLYNRSEYNIIRLILGKENGDDSPADNKYTRADVLLNKWIKENILIREPEEAIYLYLQSFKSEGRKYERLGFISLFKLPAQKENSQIFGHEKTLAKPKEDRLKLMEATKANLSSIFSIFEDGDKSIVNFITDSVENRKACKISEFVDDKNETHKLYRIVDKNLIDFIRIKMEDKNIYIADGHHRFETCLNFRNYIKSAGSNNKKINADYCMMYFAPINQEGMLILPTHRCIINKKIELKNFIDEVEKNFTVIQSDAQNIVNDLNKNKDNSSFGFIHGTGKYFVISLKDTVKNTIDNPLERLDVSILQNYIFKNILHLEDSDIDNQRFILYEKDASNAIDSISGKNNNCNNKQEKIEAVFLMNPTKIEDVTKIASLNLRMPQKSTFFYPKIISGLTINVMYDL
jgi:uncharacterized protein (DUF1015 family)